MEIDVEKSDYWNASEKRRDRKRTTVKQRSGRKIFRMAALTLGLLCVLQATLNIALRFILYNKLADEKGDLQINNIRLTEERDQLKKEIGRLNETIRVYEEERHCPQGWRKFGCSCYYASTEEKNWDQSREFCRGYKGDLVAINSRDEQIFINGLYGAYSYAWIGLSDREAEGNWTWVDGTPLTTTYWGSGQPNDEGGDQDCVVFIHRGSGQLGEWGDFRCYTESKWICEK